MKSIKVYLQYPWKFPDSPYYKYLVDNPPHGTEYLNVKKQKGVIINKQKFLFSNRLKKIIRNSLNLLNISIPNAHLSPRGEYDIIHCCHCLSKNKGKPWIADVEAEWQLYIGNKTKKSKERIRKILLRKNCKKILPWTQTTAEEIIREFPEIKHKVEVLYPAVPLQKRQKKKSGKITILYATRYFWLKGGLIALEVFKKLKQKYGDKLELIFISDVPENVKKKYSELNIGGLVPQKELYEYYKKADIFFYPSFLDTFGFGQLEAMSFGLPIITVNTKYTKTRKEIIKNNISGLIFDINDKITERLINQKDWLVISNEEKEIIDKLVKNCSKLIENKKLREKMSKNSIEMIKNGKFSIKERNKKLERIYERVLG